MSDFFFKSLCIFIEYSRTASTTTKVEKKNQNHNKVVKEMEIWVWLQKFNFLKANLFKIVFFLWQVCR